MNKTIKIIVFSFNFLLVTLGGLFLSSMVHELVHVYDASQDKEVDAQAVCIAMNAKISDELQNGYLVAVTKFNATNIQSFNTYREFTEKHVQHIEQSFMLWFGILIGAIFVYLILYIYKILKI